MQQINFSSAQAYNEKVYTDIANQFQERLRNSSLQKMRMTLQEYVINKYEISKKMTDLKALTQVMQDLT